MIDLAIRLDPLVALRTDDPPAAPEPSALAAAAAFGGADRIVIRLRASRAPIRDRDVRVLLETCPVGLELEVAGDAALVDPVLETRPERVTLVGLEGPIDTTRRDPELAEALDAFRTAELSVGLLIAPEPEAVLGAQALGVRFVRFDTSHYGHANTEDRAVIAFRQIDAASRAASEIGLRSAVGGGLTPKSASRLADLAALEQIVVGQSIAARAAFVGLETAVREFRTALRDTGTGAIR